jgi:hypothetical protein
VGWRNSADGGDADTEAEDDLYKGAGGGGGGYRGGEGGVNIPGGSQKGRSGSSHVDKALSNRYIQEEVNAGDGKVKITLLKSSV